MPEKKLLFATNNAHKVAEIQSAIGNQIEVVSLRQAGIDIEIPEPFDTLNENASEKSGTIYRLTNENCFSEDTGLEVTALGGAPGVKSARYAGEDADAKKNIEKLLSALEGKEDRSARFRTVISLVWEGKEYFFEGSCEGIILEQANGNQGFGYDPVFQPLGADRCFALMDSKEKNLYSHRRKAADKLVSFLKEQVETLNNNQYIK
jgi:XTP/dITP diphosphohydrolase